MDTTAQVRFLSMYDSMMKTNKESGFFKKDKTNSYILIGIILFLLIIIFFLIYVVKNKSDNDSKLNNLLAQKY